MGYEVKTFTQGQQALNTLAYEAFDLIITDLKMPGMGGLEFIENIRETEISSKILVITAFPTMADARAFAKLRVNGYLTKPVSVEDLERTVRSLVPVEDPAPQ